MLAGLSDDRAGAAGLGRIDVRKLLCGVLLGIAAMQLAAVSAAHAQAAADSPAVAVTYIEVAPSAEAAAAGLLKEAAAASRKEAGNQRFEVLQRLERPAHFAILEAWTDAKAFAAHVGSPTTKAFRDKLKPLQVAPYDERPNVPVSLGPIRAAGSPGAVYVISHVDVPGPFKDETAITLRQLVDAGRKEPGAERFEAWYQSNRPNHFTVTDIWQTQAALDAHLASAAVKAFREQLGPKLGALYDDRRYRNLE
jgi:quinol monooxygenase YgiN